MLVNGTKQYNVEKWVFYCTYFIRMSSILVFGSVWSIAERLGATGEFARVRLLARVRSEMCLKILQARIGLVAILKLEETQKKITI